MSALIEAKTEQGRKLAAIQQQIAKAGDVIERAVAVATGLQLCRQLVRDKLELFKSLAGSQLGFAVDNPGKTTDAQYIDAISQALLEGVQPTGNHFAIIAGRYYLQLPGWEARWAKIADEAPDIRLGTIETISDPRWDENAKRSVPGIARVEAEGFVSVAGQIYEVRYRDNRSATHGMDQRLVIRVNSGMGEDAILGKARARILKALWRVYNGEKPPSATEDDTPVAETVVSVAAAPVIAGPSEPSKLDRWSMELESVATVAEMSSLSAAYGWRDDEPDVGRAREMYAARRKVITGK